MWFVADEEMARTGEDKGASGICLVTMDPGTDGEDDDEKKTIVPDTWEERCGNKNPTCETCNGERIEDEHEIRELEKKIIKIVHKECTT